MRPATQKLSQAQAPTMLMTSPRVEKMPPPIIPPTAMDQVAFSPSFSPSSGNAGPRRADPGGAHATGASRIHMASSTRLLRKKQAKRGGTLLKLRWTRLWATRRTT